MANNSNGTKKVPIIPKNKKKERKVISRKKPSEKASKKYMDETTQASIVKYQLEPDIKIKNKLYVDEILPAFQSLTENLINVYGFHVLYETKEDLKNECLEFLFGVLNKYDVSKGSTAFSYFNIVGRNYFIIRSKQNAKNVQSYISLDNPDAMSKRELNIIEEFNFIPSIEDHLTATNLHKNLKLLVSTLKDRSKTENEKACLDAIDLLVQNIEDIDIISKRAIMLYLREITGLSSKQLSIVLSSLKKQYNQFKQEALAE